MKHIKETIPTREVLLSKLHAVMSSGLPDFIKTTNARRITVRASIHFQIVAVLFIAAISVFLFLAQVDFTTLMGKIIIMTALLWVTVLLVSGRSWFIGSTLLAREVNMALVPILANTFDQTLLYTYNENASDAVQEMLYDSTLLSDKIRALKVKNVYIVFSEFDMRVHEIEFEPGDPQTAKMSVKHHAIFIDINVRTEYPGETVISTDGSSYGFSHIDFVRELQQQEGLHIFDDFKEKYLAVFTSENTNTSSLLTAKLLNEVQSWQSETKINLRIMRKGSKLYILVPTSKESISYTSTKQESIEHYAAVIALPIWRALLLAESVKV